ncbi:MAG: S8 family serine peptidase [Acidobacteriota bacterium]|nr:S8 family serine peptidase [Acidobacteriota bacterium]
MHIPRRLALLLALLPLIGSTALADATIAPSLAARLDEGPAPFLVLLEEDPVPTGVTGTELYGHLTRRAGTSQRSLRAWLDARGIPYRPFYIVNALLVEGDRKLAETLAGRSDVRRLVDDPAVRAVEPVPLGPAPEASTDGVEWGVTMVGAVEVWNRWGSHGEGIVVASMDTGVERTHPAIIAQYRGGTGEGVDHAYSWHDAIDGSDAPWDDHGHGTHTVGTMVGDDGAGNQVGVAPGARWIACRNMDHGVGRPSSYLECMEWTLAPYPPGGDPFTDGRPEMAPQVVNNSWGCPPSEGCDTQVFDEALARLRRAGIWMVAAAGNDGPNCNTVKDPPAISPDVFTVAAVTSARATAWFSSRGPVTVDGSNRAKPQIAAPGDGVRSAVPPDGYASWSGTSMAAPHVAGVGALIWSAAPGLEGLLEISECLVERSASTPVGNFFPQNCGGISHTTYPNYISGWGIVRADAALDLPNGDGDKVADACDCAPGDGGAFAAPVEVTGLDFDDAATLRWDDQSYGAGDGTTYDLLRGTLTDLRARGGVDDATCLAAELTEAATSDPATPPPGDGFHYLVRAANACGSSDWGRASDSTPRSATACDGGP